MSILSGLFAKYGDDVLRGATKTASNYADDFFLRYGDDIARAGADKSDDAMRALLNKRGNKNMVYDAFMAQQVDNPGVDMAKIFREYGGDKANGRKMIAGMLTDSADNPPALVGYHGVSTEKLKKALDNMGGDIVNPSLQIVNPNVNPGTEYGDIILLGDKDMYFGKGQYGLVDSWGKTNAYSRDVYSPRVPDFVEKNGNRYIKGTRKLYTPENVSDFMNKQGTKAVESNWATPGSVAATQAERFNKLSDILNAAGQLGEKESNRKAYDDWGKYLTDRVSDYAEKTGKMGDNAFITIDNITSEIQDALNGKYQPDDFYGLRTPQGRELLGDISRQIADLPTDYFEAKVRRPVGLNEFTGAILPNDYADDTILQALKNAGVPVVGNYDPANMEETLQDTLKGLTKGKNRFTTPYMLGLGGLLGSGAILGKLLNGNQNQQEVM
jgi:hypothetical protein